MRAILKLVFCALIASQLGQWADGAALAQDQARSGPTIAPWSADDQRVGKSLFITDGIVDANGRPMRPEWEFGYLMRQMAGASPAAEFTRRWILSFEERQDINGLQTLNKVGLRSQVVRPWKARLGDIEMTDEEWVAHPQFLELAPFRLAAIVNRIDLVKLAQRHGAFTDEFLSPGEGRLIYQLTDRAGNPRNDFTVIFEYGIPVTNQVELGAWAADWLALSSPDLTPNAFLDALVQLTKRFTDRDPLLAKPNNNPLHQVRTNEIALGNPWELREFRIAADGWLSPSTVNLNPDFAYAGLLPSGEPDPMLAAARDLLVAYVQGCVRGEIKADVPGDVLGNSFTVPHAIRKSPDDGIPGLVLDQPFLGASAPTPFRPFIDPNLSQEIFETGPTWLQSLTPESSSAIPAICAKADMPADLGWEANRRWFAFNTCSGCHGAEAGTFFTHLDVTRINEGEHVLSSFLRLEDLPARGAALELFATLIPAPAGGSEPASATSASSAEPSLAAFLNNTGSGVEASAAASGEAEGTVDLRAFLLQMQTRIH